MQGEKAKRQAGEKKTKLLNEMSMMKPSELWKMAVDDRVRSLLKGESSQKGKGKGKGKGKIQNVYSQKLYSLYQDNNGPMSEDQVEQVMLQKKTANPQRELGQSQARRHWQWKEVGPRERQDPSTSVEGQEQRKELWKGQASERSALPRKGTGQRQKQERFHRWRVQQRLEKCTLRQSQSYKRARGPYVVSSIW